MTLTVPTVALAGVPRIAEQTGGIRDRIAQLSELDGWTEALASLQAPGSADDARAC